MTYIPHNTYLVYGDEESLGRVRALGSFVQWEGPFTSEDRIHPLARHGGRGGPDERRRGRTSTRCSSSPIPRRTKPPRRSSTPCGVGAVRSRFRVLKYENVILRLDPAQLATAGRAAGRRVHPALRRPPDARREAGPDRGRRAGGRRASPVPATCRSSPRRASRRPSSPPPGSRWTCPTAASTTAPPRRTISACTRAGSSAGSAASSTTAWRACSPAATIQGCDGHGTINAHIIAGFSNLTGFPFEDADGYKYGLGIAPFVKVGSSVIFYSELHLPELPEPPVARLSRRRAHQLEQLGLRGQRGLQRGLAGLRCARARRAAFRLRGARRRATSRWSSSSPPATPGPRRAASTRRARPRTSSPPAPARTCAPSAAPTSAASTTWARTPIGDIASFSSRGPTTDGRRKPDLVAPGTHVTGGVFQTDTPGADRPGRRRASTAPASAAGPSPASSPTASSSTRPPPAPATPRPRSRAGPRSCASTSSTRA